MKSESAKRGIIKFADFVQNHVSHSAIKQLREAMHFITHFFLKLPWFLKFCGAVDP
jgi:hypothetical protein